MSCWCSQVSQGGGAGSQKCEVRGGRVVLVGYCRKPVSLDAMEFMSNKIQLRSSIEHNRWELARVIELRALGKIDLSKSITHSVSRSGEPRT